MHRNALTALSSPPCSDPHCMLLPALTALSSPPRSDPHCMLLPALTALSSLVSAGVMNRQKITIFHTTDRLKHMLKTMCDGLKRDWECAGSPKGVDRPPVNHSDSATQSHNPLSPTNLTTFSQLGTQALRLTTFSHSDAQASVCFSLLLCNTILVAHDA